MRQWTMYITCILMIMMYNYIVMVKCRMWCIKIQKNNDDVMI